MSKETTEDRFKEVITDILGTPENEIHPDTNIVTDLGADSLDIVGIVIACEEEFGVSISDEDAKNVKTFQEAVDLINKLTA